jgi:uracil phosphoribosyltransferase
VLHVVDHPLLKRALAVLRDRTTPSGPFRHALNDAAMLLAVEATRDLPVEAYEVETPLETTTGHRLARPVVVVPVLRAGLGMLDGFTRMVPEARVGHLGMFRDERTLSPVSYYANVPRVRGARVFVLDPMLATGGSASSAVAHLKERGAGELAVVCLVAAPEGVRRLEEYHPDVPVFAAALDRELDQHAFIRPGLGDAGDRIFGTEAGDREVHTAT